MKLEQFLGGSPLRVAIKLAVLSLIVGFVLVSLNITPRNLIDGAFSLVRHAIDRGFALLGDIGTYILAGAVIVIPLWLLLRLMKSRQA